MASALLTPRSRPAASNVRAARPDVANHALTDLEYRLLIVARAAHAAGETPVPSQLARRAGFKYDDIANQRFALHQRGLWPWEAIPVRRRQRPNANPAAGKTGLESESAEFRRAAAQEAANLAATTLAGLTGGIKDDARPSYAAPAWAAGRPGEFRGFHTPARAWRGPDDGETCRGFIQEWKRSRRLRAERRAS